MLFALLSAFCFAVCSAQTNEKIVIIKTNVGTMKVRLYADVPKHVNTFVERVNKGAFDGTLFTRVIREFMIQGGAIDSRNAAPGARCGFGSKRSEILPEINPKYFHKKGALAAPRHPDDINPEKKSDMSQFFIVHGKVYREGELDTLERIANKDIRTKALNKYYKPERLNLKFLKRDNPYEFNKRLRRINALVDSTIRATPGHLLFSPEQRKAYTTIGGCHHLDGVYTIYGEVFEGLDIIDTIAEQAKDKYDRPKKDMRILSIRIQSTKP